ncbi:unnamed protein product [Clonostachys rhizophaga]|uniref:Uncharacterized protein n=1 Tax=Clonostachys rhizophaga TaxID=160324 RepID=A0A9N9VKL3_9HYPO|nr:unnamed protein product [Clonostachys rhizophaga]
MDTVGEAPFSFEDFFPNLGGTQGLDLGTDPSPFPPNSIPPAQPDGTDRPNLSFTLQDNADSSRSQKSFPNPAKNGARFSSTSRRILKDWFESHPQQPYPTVGDIERIQRQTGLSRQQILGWFSNARRRRKPQPRHRPSTPIIRPAGPNLDASLEQMNPLERWQNSPPDQEPATAFAIARAAETQAPASHHSSDSGKPLDPYWDDSSASSAVASYSSGSSFASSHYAASYLSRYSGGSHGSASTLEHLRKSIKRRRRRLPRRKPTHNPLNSLTQVDYTFQCTFCTETFKTKHNWKRHERCLHLSLEQWECSPYGPTMLIDGQGTNACVYCGELNPDQAHLVDHNPMSCSQRAGSERLFYRKDHLQQHLKLVHMAGFRKCPMEKWKQVVEQVRWRCGFCDTVGNSWSDRIDHLAEHFQTGKTMADWTGDWGFEEHILDMVENSMPPCKPRRNLAAMLTGTDLEFTIDFIHAERSSPWPFTTQQGPPETPVSAFDLLTLELEHFRISCLNTEHREPSYPELQYEACCVIFGSELFCPVPVVPRPSWLRDLLMSSEDISQRARLRPVKDSSSFRITQLQIHGKDNIFQDCGLERELQKYVETFVLLELTIENCELQSEAGRIALKFGEVSSIHSEIFVPFLNSLIFGSTEWLEAFRQRARLMPVNSFSLSAIDPTCALGSQTFLEQSILETPAGLTNETYHSETALASPSPPTNAKAPSSFLHDSNCYRRLTRELSRFVASTTSSRNPAQHIPSDEELRHHARWIMFQDDDQWNQTPADNPYWLLDFKREVGLQTNDSAEAE